MQNNKEYQNIKFGDEIIFLETNTIHIIISELLYKHNSIYIQLYPYPCSNLYNYGIVNLKQVKLYKKKRKEK